VTLVSRVKKAALPACPEASRPPPSVPVFPLMVTRFRVAEPKLATPPTAQQPPSAAPVLALPLIVTSVRAMDGTWSEPSYWTATLAMPPPCGALLLSRMAPPIMTSEPRPTT
jgi:hypothetical protein